MLEAQARHDLESDGCPPCYPPYLDVPVRNPPEEYRQIVGYWRSITSTGDVVLCAQRSDWRNFRHSQQRLRHRYRNQPFSSLLDKVIELRRAHGLDDNVLLLLDPQQQSRQQNWVEFQHYHLKLYEWQKRERDGLQQKLDNYRREAGDGDREGSEHTALRNGVLYSNLNYAERNLRWHEVLLCWIEEHRLAMNPLLPIPAEKGSGDQHSPSKQQRRSKHQGTPAVLGKARVSKSTPKRQNTRTQTSKAMTSKAIFLDPAVKTPSSTQEQLPKRREIKPRRAKEKALAQILR